MAPETMPWLESGNLRICPELGEVRNSRGEAARLRQINMKVLLVLLSRPGRVVSRDELFEVVWKNQVVSDDVLTRSISDIRALLSQLSGHSGHIETLPKRGYRWIGDVRTAQASEDSPIEEPRLAHPMSAPDTPSVPPSSTAADPQTQQRRSVAEQPALRRHRLLTWIGQGAMYLAALVLLASLGVWLMGQLARSGTPVVAVLPTRAQPLQRDVAAAIEQHVTDYLMGLDRVELLSASAIESRPGNPFPYFYHEFGARWLIESDLRNISGQTVLTLTLVDARAGIVLFRSTKPIAAAGGQDVAKIEPALLPIGEFIESQIEP